MKAPESCVICRFCRGTMRPLGIDFSYSFQCATGSIHFSSLQRDTGTWWKEQAFETRANITFKLCPALCYPSNLETHSSHSGCLALLKHKDNGNRSYSKDQL